MKKVREIEAYFLAQQALLGNLADGETFEKIFYLIRKLKQYDESLSRVTAVNRHYLYHFYNGDVLQMAKDFDYLVKSREGNQ